MMITRFQDDIENDPNNGWASAYEGGTTDDNYKKLKNKKPKKAKSDKKKRNYGE